MAASNGNLACYSGIDIDIPSGRKPSSSTPDSVHDAVVNAFEAGAPGVILARKYSEMMLANLSGAGRALQSIF